MISWYVVIRVDIDEETCDPADVIAEMDYTLNHPDIRDTEIVDVVTEDYF